MVSIFARGTNVLSNKIQIIGNQLRPIAATGVTKATNHNEANIIAGNSSVRLAHSDVTIPDYSYYRHKQSSGVTNFRDKEYDRKERVKTYNYAVTAGLYMGGGVALRGILEMMRSNWAPTDDVLALASIEVPITEVPEGKSVTFKWRGKPLFIRHRSPSEIEREESVPLEELRDPQHDNQRVTNSKYLIVVGICTHLGCVPIPDAGDFGGFYCPCHGSHYDASGRIRKGPAPLNLEVPEHTYLTDDIVKIG